MQPVAHLPGHIINPGNWDIAATRTLSVSVTHLGRGPGYYAGEQKESQQKGFHHNGVRAEMVEETRAI
ncbi:hypothetical protein GCM10022406_27020 [Hymenobacter algoricola]|uniref:Uncharacterized protein n=1 Tax=Hymenobacter algoricola TaxID=486267 RepID=A0ABP7NB03_9BACT